MISIVIPVYNGIEFLQQSLESVIKQTYTLWEVIIGINGHPHKSDVELEAISVVHSFMNTFDITNRIVVKHYNTTGKPNTLNKMIEDCLYDHIAILDVDDIWERTKLEKQMQYINDYDVVGTRCLYFGERQGSPDIPVGDISEFDFIYCNPIINSSAIVKKELCYWENIYTGLEDYNMWLWLRSRNKRFYNIDEYLCYHRIHKSSHFNNTNHNYVESLRRDWLAKIKN